MMDLHYFIGIDISKATLDWAVYHQPGICFQVQTTNLLDGIQSALRLLKKLADCKPTQIVFCMEHTGIYNAHLLNHLHQLRLPS